ncbi:hypothetical protein GMD78_10320 [Ornithinibacillus sp. L9]|uniref:RsgI N-terminal anti-sigma domain-containing protein n=1 Tax=Ornithinibacillus caprae TaxID=2678566 RepID=A0A6N8FLD2_9BACI|nr:hypothetical protein [Ornithinibacillus caprae]MUK88787.1 hypothetical protein [Ornithinibacillus caprae]
MNKGIVMEHQRNYTIVMTKDGLFEKAHPVSSEIGEEVLYEPFTSKNWFLDGLLAMKENALSFRVIAMACVITLIMIPVLTIMNQDKAYAYVDIDINPSVELEIDKEYRVSSINPINEDASMIVQELDHVIGKKVETAIELVIQEAETTGLYNLDRNVLVGINYVKDGDTTLDELLDGYFSEDPNFEWNIVTMQIPTEIRDAAKEMKRSMNQVLAETIEEESSEEIVELVTNDEREIIQSFYNDTDESLVIEEKSDEAEDDQNAKENNGKSDISKDDEEHPSELKGENGKVNSSGKNIENNSKVKNSVNKKDDNAKPSNSQADKAKKKQKDKGKEPGKQKDNKQKNNKKNDKKNNKKNDHKNNKNKNNGNKSKNHPSEKNYWK